MSTTKTKRPRGRPALSVEELKRRGTYRSDRHASRLPEDFKILCRKPALRPKTKCGDPGKWVRNIADERAIANGCYFDESRAVYVAEWFRKYLRHSKGQWAGKPFELLDWQRDDLIFPLFGWMRENGTRRFRKTFIELPKKNGKALALDTPLPTPTGWTTMGEVNVGDLLFDENGLPCRVLAATEVMVGRPCYRVCFSDGASMVADAAHQWVTRARSRDGRFAVCTTQEMASQLRIETPGSEGFNHSIEVAGALLTDPIELPIPPYVLGAWLGDGDTANARFTCGDCDSGIVNEIIKSGITAARLPRPGGRYLLGGGVRTQAARNSSLQAKMRRIGVLGNKHIPAAYLRASESDRMAMLQGLMDTDGYVSAAGQCEFTTTCRPLCDGVMELMRTLGFKPLLTEARATLCGRDCGPKYRVQFWAFQDRPVFRLARKVARLKPAPNRRARSMSRQVVAVEKVDSVPVRCVQVDSPSHLYLASASMIPTHNSTLASGVGLYMLCGDGEQGAEVYSAATDRDQAGIVHGEAINMVEASPELSEALSINRTTKNILYEATKSYYRAISAKPQGKEGFNGNCYIADELHAWHGDELWNAMRYMGRSRVEPLGFVITTAGDDTESVCYKQLEYARGVLAGTILDDRYFGYIREIGADEDFTTPEARRKANPSMGITIDESEFIADVEEAKQSPSAMASMLRYSFNVWTTSSSPFISLTKWAACGDDFKAQDLAGRDCYAGLDLAKSLDMTSMVLWFPPMKDDPRHLILPWFWMPEQTAHDRKHLASYLAWEKAGLLTLTKGEVCDYEQVQAEIEGIFAQFNCREMAYDSYNAEQITQRIEEKTGVTRVAFPQTVPNFAPPTAEFERLVLDGRLGHNRHAVMNWQMSNVKIKQDQNNNKRPEKPKRGDHRTIDGVVAAIMALARAMLNENQEASVYESRGVLVL